MIPADLKPVTDLSSVKPASVNTGGLSPVNAGVNSEKTTPQNTQVSAGLTGAEALKTAALALGLPADALSRALLAFSGIFSITPDSALLSRLRKEILDSGTSSPKDSREKLQLEAKTLAALAAFDKGVVLGRESLRLYSAVPDSGDFSGDDFFGESNDPDDHGSGRQPDAQGFQQFFQDFNRGGSEKDRLFGYLNRIPGKNGRHWAVWPFNYSRGGTELKVLVRILIKEPFFSLNRKDDDNLVIVDITGPKRNWRFLLRTGEELTSDVSIVPGLPRSDAGKLTRYLAEECGIKCRIHNGRELLLADEFAEALPSVNEQV